MVAETQNIQEQLNTINTNTENRLQQITKEIWELVDEPEDNDKLELSWKLTSNVADILKEHPDVAKNLLDIMNSISQDNTDLNNDPSRIELQNFIKPYIQSFDFASSNITDTKWHFVKGIDNENHNKVSEAITLIDSLKNELTDNNIIIDPELGLTLQNISSILAKPNNDNTKILQDFLRVVQLSWNLINKEELSFLITYQTMLI